MMTEDEVNWTKKLVLAQPLRNHKQHVITSIRKVCVVTWQSMKTLFIKEKVCFCPV